ncbi:DUF4202 domain-containing protein [Candidatus Methylospira mobilis]|uniref:DUF4202 domain-containing protein n=1 Tax=Candidatus Methylospira mobilis TaxID=1808979 RepID=UPI0028EB1464|nr:DUF4202 domain-containing protein [Candidatus Methylospira mobilis]WNV06319.1 DUF4202 domain-containing protein [Candidatus Methylospira mobilis]
MTLPNQRLQRTLDLIDAANSEDPNHEIVDGNNYPKELLYGQRMSVWLARVEPNPRETWQIAARAQHICRWEIPRDTYPMDRIGYLEWRKRLYRFHADKVGAIMRQTGYEEPEITEVQRMLLKSGIKADASVQLLEDMACLVFLDHYLEDFIAKHGHDEAKLIDIVRKSWKKMSDRGHRHAAEIALSAEAQRVIGKALAGSE